MIYLLQKTDLHQFDVDLQGTHQINQASVRRTGSLKQIEGTFPSRQKFGERTLVHGSGQR